MTKPDKPQNLEEAIHSANESANELKQEIVKVLPMDRIKQIANLLTRSGWTMVLALMFGALALFTTAGVILSYFIISVVLYCVAIFERIKETIR